MFLQEKKDIKEKSGDWHNIINLRKKTKNSPYNRKGGYERK